MRIKICNLCGKEYTNKRKHNKQCEKRRHKENFKWTEKERLNISNKRKEYIKNNPQNHNWYGNNSKKSNLELKIQQFLSLNNVSFISDYNDIRWNKYYRIDIAIVDKKLGIEINGNQHYISQLDDTLTEYYQQRHSFLEKQGWIIYEIRYSKCNDEWFNNLIYFINSFNSISKNEIEEINYFNRNNIKLINENNNKIQYEIAKINGKIDISGKINNNKLSNQEIEYRKQQILSSNIDLTKFGWVNKVSKITGLTRRQINNIVNKTDLKNFVYYR